MPLTSAWWRATDLGVVLLLIAPGCLFAQEPSACEPHADAEAELVANQWGGGSCTPEEPCWEEKLEALRTLRTRFPGDVQVHRAFQDVARVKDAEGVVAEYEGLLAQHPDGPMWHYLAGRLYFGERLASAADAALALDPSYPLAHVARTAAYLQEEPPQAEKAFEHLQRFTESCPSRFQEPLAYAGSVGSDEFWRSRLPTLRAQLAAAAPLEALRYLRLLWALDFRLLPPTEHDVARQGVRQDLARLETSAASDPALSLNGLYLEILEEGYELVRDGERAASIREARARASACDPEVASRSVRDWLAARGANEAAQTLPAEQARELCLATTLWIEKCPRSYVYWSYRMLAVRSLGGVGDLGETQLLAEIDGFLAMWETQKKTIGTARSPYAEVADLLLERRLALDRLPELVAKERAYVESRRHDPEQVPERLRATYAEANARTTIQLDLLATRVAIALGQAKEARELLDSLDSRLVELAAMPETTGRLAPGYRSDALSLRADLALVEGQRPDAVVYLRRAAAELPVGEPRAQLERRALELWRELGGSEESFRALGSLGDSDDQPGDVGDGIQEAEQHGPWSPDSAPLEPFELVDLQGKTWTRQDLRGKTVLINLWATWCGPCRAELPYLQRLQDELRERQDLKIVTFNLDHNPGLIVPYMDKEGLHFPVLLAERHVQGLFGGFAIPQNWIVDPEGIVRLRQSGFSLGVADTWVADTRSALEKVAGLVD